MLQLFIKFSKVSLFLFLQPNFCWHIVRNKIQHLPPFEDCLFQPLSLLIWPCFEDHLKTHHLLQAERWAWKSIVSHPWQQVYFESSNISCPHAMNPCSFHWSFSPFSELTPEEKAQKIAKAMRKQSAEVKEKWESLNTCASGWQKQIDQALEKLKDLQCSMDDLDADLREAENVRNCWKPVGDRLMASLQDEVDKTTVRSQ